MNVQAAEEARDATVWGCEHPEYIPVSRDTVSIPAQPLTRFSLRLDLDGGSVSDVDRMMAALLGWSMAGLAGLAWDAENKARIAERKAIADQEAKRPRVVNATTALAPGSVPSTAVATTRRGCLLRADERVQRGRQCHRNGLRGQLSGTGRRITS